MNIDTYLEYLKSERYNLYNYWESTRNELKDRTDLLISYYQKELIIENAELKAKVYTYEKIIENSNFKPILNKKGEH